MRCSAGGKGVGTKLLSTIVDSVRSRGGRSIVLNTQADVPWNQPWYERRGFKVVLREDWTPDMHVIAEEQRADGLDWNTRVQMRLYLDPPECMLAERMVDSTLVDRNTVGGGDPPPNLDDRPSAI